MSTSFISYFRVVVFLLTGTCRFLSVFYDLCQNKVAKTRFCWLFHYFTRNVITRIRNVVFDVQGVFQTVPLQYTPHHAIIFNRCVDTNQIAT